MTSMKLEEECARAEDKEYKSIVSKNVHKSTTYVEKYIIVCFITLLTLQFIRLRAHARDFYKNPTGSEC